VLKWRQNVLCEIQDSVPLKLKIMSSAPILKRYPPVNTAFDPPLLSLDNIFKSSPRCSLHRGVNQNESTQALMVGLMTHWCSLHRRVQTPRRRLHRRVQTPRRRLHRGVQTHRRNLHRRGSFIF
jgi:hypothetical protein